MLPIEIQNIKKEIRTFLASPNLDRSLSQKIHDEVLEYCKNETDDQSNFKQESSLKSSYYESARGTMQLVYNMVADDNFIFHHYKTIEDNRFNRYGFKMALQELENAEKKGIVPPGDNPWQKFLEAFEKMPECVKEFSQSKEIKELTDKFLFKMNEVHLDNIIKPQN